MATKAGFLKTHHLKFIDGILHQLHEPHQNITDKTPEWVPVESEETKAAGEPAVDGVPPAEITQPPAAAPTPPTVS